LEARPPAYVVVITCRYRRSTCIYSRHRSGRDHHLRPRCCWWGSCFLRSSFVI
jgi:hypothetical protein